MRKKWYYYSCEELCFKYFHSSLFCGFTFNSRIFALHQNNRGETAKILKTFCFLATFLVRFLCGCHIRLWQSHDDAPVSEGNWMLLEGSGCWLEDSVWGRRPSDPDGQKAVCTSHTGPTEHTLPSHHYSLDKEKKRYLLKIFLSYVI